ncbi:MAG: type II toxin-antitoxin system VapC family toxin [Thermofilum sp.]
MKLIDTSWLIEILGKKAFEESAVSIITLVELLRGVPAGKHGAVRKLLQESFGILGIDDRVVEVYCELYDSLERRGQRFPTQTC